MTEHEIWICPQCGTAYWTTATACSKCKKTRAELFEMPVATFVLQQRPIPDQLEYIAAVLAAHLNEPHAEAYTVGAIAALRLIAEDMRKQPEDMTEPTPVPPGTVTIPFDRPVTVDAGTYVFEVSGDGKRVIRAIPVTVTHADRG